MAQLRDVKCEKGHRGTAWIDGAPRTGDAGPPCSAEFQREQVAGEPETRWHCGAPTRVVLSSFEVTGQAQWDGRIPSAVKENRLRKKEGLLVPEGDRFCEVSCACGETFEAWLPRSVDVGAPCAPGDGDGGARHCPSCGATEAVRAEPGAPLVSMRAGGDENFVRKMEDRSKRDSFASMAKEPEKHGFMAARKPRAWNRPVLS